MTDLESFLSDVTGVVHVGANVGQEIPQYHSFDLDVIWIEPFSEAYEILEHSLQGYPKQRCFKELITDVDDKIYTFYISNNGGCSSSIFDIEEHRYCWPDVTMSYVMLIPSITLTTLFTYEHIDPLMYDGLVLDTQGSELLVLMGALPILSGFKYIKVEVADFEAYAGGCQLKDIEAFMKLHGYIEYIKYEMPTDGYHPKGGHYYDIVYKRN